MKKLMVLFLVVAAGYLSWQKLSDNSAPLELLYQQPYVVVYGRDTCGWTQRYLEDIRDSGMVYVYKNVGDAGVGDELHPRMRQAGLDTGYYLLPVIDVNASMLIRPEMETVLAKYNIESR